MSDSSFKKLCQTIAALRDPVNGCPWDLKQTHTSLKQYLIEEAHELLDAIDNQPEEICNELGDVLLQVMLHAQIAKDEKRFDIEAVIEHLNNKLIERHPHVFGEHKIESAEEVAKNWAQSKKDKSTGKSSMLSGISKSLPALHKANLIGARVATVGFDWTEIQGVVNKVEEELNELKEALAQQNKANISEELGDLFFTLAQYSRKLELNPEELLNKACNKFMQRFEHMETISQKPLSECINIELEELWNTAKNNIK